jgi:hypothetical protein
VIDDRVKEFPRVLRITVGKQLHGALHISEKNCDLLALAFESGFGSQDLFGEMLGRVGLGRREIRSRGDLTKRRSTLAAEFVCRGIGSFTGRA